MWAWRAHALGGAAELRLEHVRRPPLLRADQLLVRVTAAGLNPLDAAMLRGYGATLLELRRRLAPDAPAAPPLTVGRDAAGEVEAAGPGAALRPGARVWLVAPPHAPGTLAQRVLVRSAWAGPAPRALDPLQAGGALYAALSARAALRQAPGRRLLLLGLGGVGQAALQLATAAGARVTVACAADARDLALELGAEEALDYRAEDYDERLAAADRFDGIVDCAGLGGWEASARRWRFSRYVTLTTPLLGSTDARGVCAGGAAAAAALGAQCAAAARAQGSAAAVRWAFFSGSRGEIERLRRLAEAGRLRVVVQRAWSWRQAPAALLAAEGGHARGKLLLDFTAD